VSSALREARRNHRMMHTFSLQRMDRRPYPRASPPSLAGRLPDLAEMAEGLMGPDRLTVLSTLGRKPSSCTTRECDDLDTVDRRRPGPPNDPASKSTSRSSEYNLMFEKLEQAMENRGRTGARVGTAPFVGTGLPCDSPLGGCRRGLTTTTVVDSNGPPNFREVRPATRCSIIAVLRRHRFVCGG